jgi:hypothetical protein
MKKTTPGKVAYPSDTVATLGSAVIRVNGNGWSP